MPVGFSAAAPTDVYWRREATRVSHHRAGGAMNLGGSFLSLYSARFSAEPRRAAAGEEAPTGSTSFLSGTDAEYPESGIPERRKKECHWLGVWNDEAELDRFLLTPRTHIPRLSDAESSWGLKLIPYMRRGAEILPLDPHRSRPRFDEPIVIITSIGPYTREADVATAGQSAKCARETLPRADGLMHELIMIPYPPIDLFTITAWRSEAAAQAWAYKGQSHRIAMDFHKTASERARVSFTRCLIGASFGDWPHTAVGSGLRSR